MKLRTKMMAVFALAVSLCAQPADRFAGVAPRMQELVDQGEAAGVVTLVASKDRILYLGAVGRTDMAKDRKMRADDIFWIASMSKPITTVCIAILADEGKLSFDDPLAKHLPEFAAVRVTLRQVMSHTSGLGEMTKREPHLTLAETSRMLSQQPLRFEPGSRWGYSTAGIDILGRVVEVVGGMPFDAFLQKRVLDPLGMKDTSFWIAPEKESRYAHPYRWHAEAPKLTETAIGYLYGTAVTDRERPPLGGAGLFSTAEDLARFYQMMLNRGAFNGQRILKPETAAEMTRKQTGALTARPGMPWGLGFCVVEDPTKMAANSVLSPNSFGHGGAFSTQSWADPAKNLVWVIMFERDGKGNGDNSDVRIAFQEAAAEGLLSPALGLAQTAPPITLPKPRMEGGKPLMQALKERRSARTFKNEKLPLQVLSDLLWAAWGENRPGGQRTAPSAVNAQEVDIYVALPEGVYLFEARSHSLKPVLGGDHRSIAGTQPFVPQAPLNLIYVADFAKMGRAKPEDRPVWAAAGTGFIGQNVYLYCASEGLATVFRAFVDREVVAKTLQLRPDQRVMFAQTVGYPLATLP